MSDVLNKTKNYFRCVGVVSEVDLTREDCEIKLKDKDGNDDGTMKGERIRGKIAVNTGKGVQEFRVFFQSHNSKPDKNGKRENSRWKMAESMMEWNPAINGNGDEPTLVNIEGTFDVNDYVGQDGNVKSGIQMNISKASTKVSADDPKGCSWNGVVYIKDINAEVINDNETGRLNVTLLGVNGKSEVFPIKAIVEEDLAEDFVDSENGYEVEQTVPMYIDIITRHIGQKKATKKAFGRGGSVEVNNGFDVTEFVIVGADDPIEEPEDEDDDGNPIDNGWLDPKVVKKAIKERAKKLEELKANGGATEKKGSIKEAKKLGKTKTKAVEPYDDEDDPF